MHSWVINDYKAPLKTESTELRRYINLNISISRVYYRFIGIIIEVFSANVQLINLTISGRNMLDKFSYLSA